MSDRCRLGTIGHKKSSPVTSITTLRPRQDVRHFSDDIFKCIFLNDNAWIFIKISLKLVRYGPINNIPALVQIMAWRRPGGKPLSEPMMVRLSTHICVTRPQWVTMITTVRHWVNDIEGILSYLTVQELSMLTRIAHHLQSLKPLSTLLDQHSTEH